MAKTMKYSVLTGTLLLVLLTTSCRDSSPATSVLRGNLTYGRGQYQKSILHYLEAEDSAASGRDVIYYDLANVYFALGEGDAALRAWSQAENATDDVNLLFRIAFNRGVLYYQRGHYDEAYRAFRQALLIRPSDLEAKINLEESLSRVRATAPASPESGLQNSRDEGDADKQRLLDYVRRKEVDAWTSEEDTGNSNVADW